MSTVFLPEPIAAPGVTLLRQHHCTTASALERMSLMAAQAVLDELSGVPSGGRVT